MFSRHFHLSPGEKMCDISCFQEKKKDSHRKTKLIQRKEGGKNVYFNKLMDQPMAKKKKLQTLNICWRNFHLKQLLRKRKKMKT